VSYAIPILLRVTAARTSFRTADFSLGRWSILCGWLSGVWLMATSLIFFLPTTWPITGANMNYACVVVAAFALVGGVYWVVAARHFFQGPPRHKSQGGYLPEPDAFYAPGELRIGEVSRLNDPFTLDDEQ